MFPVKITEKRRTGNLGEALAIRYVKNKGFIVLARNYSLPCGELDIVASKGGVIHFIEVKSVTCEMLESGVSREMSQLFNPAERIDTRKLGKVEKAARSYLASRGSLDSDWQIDAALVWIDSEAKRAKVEFIERVTRDL